MLRERITMDTQIGCSRDQLVDREKDGETFFLIRRFEENHRNFKDLVKGRRKE